MPEFEKKKYEHCQQIYLSQSHWSREHWGRIARQVEVRKAESTPASQESTGRMQILQRTLRRLSLVGQVSLKGNAASAPPEKTV